MSARESVVVSSVSADALAPTVHVFINHDLLVMYKSLSLLLLSNIMYANDVAMYIFLNENLSNLDSLSIESF